MKIKNEMMSSEESGVADEDGQDNYHHYVSNSVAVQYKL